MKQAQSVFLVLAAVLGMAGCGDDGGGAGGPAPDDCITDVSANDAHVFECDGIVYNVSVPEDCADGGCGLIFDVHGFSMSGEMQEANTRLAERGREHGYVVVQPNANPAPPAASWDGARDDPKVFDFMQRAMAAFVIDPDRVHFTGFSQGGFMTWRFVCDHGDLLASAAPAAADAGQASCISNGEAPEYALPILHIQGTADTLVAYDDALATRDALVAQRALGEPQEVSSDDAHRWLRYGADGEAPYEWLEHDYGGALVGDGHCFPGSTDTGGAEGQLFPFACEGEAAFDWGAEVMAFFLAHPRVGAE